jgi:NADP-dependent 3-hydroxy acid dehydrogenase YdfG
MKNLVITGASRGIGKAIAIEFAKNGFNIVFCSRSKDKCEELLNELKNINSDQSFYYLPTDMSIKSAVIEFTDFVKSKFTQIDVLINNAGVYLPGLAYNATDNVIEKTIETNLYSAVYSTHNLVPLMIEKKSGHIFNISSIAGLQAYKNGGAYTISKYALQGFNDALRDELREMGIRVTSINPGAVLTDSWEGVELPPERFMDASDIGKTVFDIYQLSKRTVVEKIILRPQLGDI